MHLTVFLTGWRATGTKLTFLNQLRMNFAQLKNQAQVQENFKYEPDRYPW
jgi:hypothetical protein